MKMKTKLLIIIGIISAILCSIMVMALSISDTYHPAFHEDYPRISQNDRYCWTHWWITHTKLNDEQLITSLGDTIAGFGLDVDVPDRDIYISYETHMVVSVAGIWTENQTQYQILTSVIKEHIQDAKIVREDLVSCA